MWGKLRWTSSRGRGPGGRGIAEDKERGMVSSKVMNHISLTRRCHGL